MRFSLSEGRVVGDNDPRTSGEHTLFVLQIDNCNFGSIYTHNWHDGSWLPGAAYIKSTAYKERFGSNHGLWLVVTSGGERRIANLMKQTAERAVEDARLFYFATLDKVMSKNFLVASIWNQAGSSQTVALVKNNEKEDFLRR